MVHGICRSPCRRLLLGLTLSPGRIDKKMHTASRVPNWMLIIYERQQRFNDQAANQMATDFAAACNSVGTTTSTRRSGNYLT